MKAKDIRETEYQPIEWVVDGLIGPGVTFITGKSKIGKSFKALQIANAVETGGTFLGLKCAKGSVLHYSLEDGRRRNQSRWKTMGIQPSEAMYQFRDRKPKIPLLTLGLEEEIEDWIKNTPDAKLVIIDPYVKVKKTIGGYKLNAYENDNFNLQNIYTLANKYNIAIVFLHHTKKKSEDDVFDEMSGSAGIQSNCDSMIVLSSNRRIGQNVVLSCIPKDAEQKEFEIALNAKCIWEYVGKPGEANRTKLQKTILAAVKKLNKKDGVKVGDIKNEVRSVDDSWSLDHVQVEVDRLHKKDEIFKIKRGVYKMAPI
jgi:RecA-family ATPase